MNIKKQMEEEEQRNWLINKIGMEIYYKAKMNIKNDKRIKWIDKIIGTDIYKDILNKEMNRLFEIEWEKSK